MKKLFCLTLALTFLFGTKSYAQCYTVPGGTVCSTNGTLTNYGFFNAKYSWDSVRISQNVSLTIRDSGSVSTTSEYMTLEIVTHCPKNVQVWVKYGTGAYSKFNLDNYTWNGQAGNEHIYYSGYKGISLVMIRDSCGVNIADTGSIFIRKLCEFPNQLTSFGNQNWIENIFKWKNPSISTAFTDYLGSGNNQSINFTHNFGSTAPPLQNNCSICPTATSNDSFAIEYRMDSILPRGFYQIKCTTSNDMTLTCKGGGSEIFNYWTNGSSKSTKLANRLIRPNSNGGRPGDLYVLTTSGKWIYQLKTDTGSLVADFSLCKMDGDYTWGVNKWNAYVYDYNNPVYDGYGYQGTFTSDSATFAYSWPTQPTLNNYTCGVTMDDSSYLVTFLMRKSFQAGKYKVRVKSQQGGQCFLSDSNGVVKYYISNTGVASSYDVTSPFMNLSGDTFFTATVYKYTTNTAKLSFVSCREPKDPGHITVSRDTACVGDQITLTADTADGTETQWYKKSCAGAGGLYIGSGASITVTMDTSTTFYVRNRSLAYASGDTTNKLDIFSVNCANRRIIAVPYPSAPTAPTAQSACSSGSHVFTFSSVTAGANGNQVQWATNSAFTNSHIIASGGSFNDTVANGYIDTIWLRSKRSDGGCVSSAVTTTATNYANPAPPTAPSSQSICSDTAYTFTFDSVQVGAGGDSIQWALNSAFTSSHMIKNYGRITINVDTANVDTIWLRSKVTSTGCVSYSVPTMAEVHKLPHIVITPADTNVGLWERVTLAASGGTNYEWIGFNNTTSGFTVTGIRDTARYIVQGTDTNQCSARDTATVRATPSLLEDIVLTITPFVDTLEACVTDTYSIVFSNNSSVNQTFAIKLNFSNSALASTFAFIDSAGATKQYTAGQSVVFIRFASLPPSANPDTLTYILRLPCATIPVSGVVPALTMGVSVTAYNGSTFGGTYNVNNTTTNNPVTLSIPYTFPKIVNIPNGTFYTIGVSRTITSLYANIGTGQYAGPITFDGQFACDTPASLSFDKIRLLINGLSIDSLAPTFFPVTFSNVILNPGDTLTIDEVIHTLGCPSSCTKTFSLGWGCTNEVCRHENRLITLAPTAAKPVLLVSRIVPLPDPIGATDQFAWEGTCVNTETEWSFLIMNLSHSVPADSVEIFLTGGMNTYTYIADSSVHFTPGDTLFSNVPAPVIPLIVNGTTNPQINPMDSIEASTPCYNAINSPLVQTYKLRIPRLDTMQNVVLSFRTFRCCASDNVYNTGVDFNRWHLFASYYDQCDSARVYANTSSDAIPYLHYTYLSPSLSDTTKTYRAYNTPADAAISSHLRDNPSIPDLQLIQEFQQDIIDVTGAHSGCGAWNDFRIKNISFPNSIATEYDAQLYCASAGVGSLGNHPKGRFKVEINCQQGLEINSIIEPVIIHNSTVWHPSQVVFISTDSAFAVFDMDSLPLATTSIAFRNFFTGSDIHFQLRGCCPADNAEPGVIVNTLFMPLIEGQVCDSCWIPLSQISFELHLHCPGCITPGIIANDFNLIRLNLGLRDSLDHGEPDQSPISVITTNYGSYSSLNLKGSVIGDLLEGTVSGNWYNGDMIDGFTYEQWQQFWLDSLGSKPQLDHFYVEQQINGADAVGLLCTGASVTYTSGSSIVLTDTIPGISVSSPLAINADGRLLFHLRIDSTWAPNDTSRYYLKAQYHICNNPDTVTTLEINNWMYLSLDSLTQEFPHQQGTPELGYTYDLNDSLNFPDSVVAGPAGYSPDDDGPALWICEAYAGAHYIYPVTAVYGESWTDFNQCSNKITIRAGYEIKGSHSNMFPNEYKMVPGIDQAFPNSGPVLVNSDPFKFHLSIPFGYKASVLNTYTESQSYWNQIQHATIKTQVLADDITGPPGGILGPASGEFYLNLDSCYYTPPFQNNGTIIHNPLFPYPIQNMKISGVPVLALGDESFIQVMNFNIRPICDQDTSLVTAILDSNAYAIGPDFNSGCVDSLSNLVINDTYTTVISIPTPNVALTATSGTVQGDLVSYFQFKAQNAGVASNFIVYLDVDSLPNGVTLLCGSTQPHCAGLMYPDTTIVSSGDTFIRYTLGNVSSTGTNVYLTMSIDTCIFPNQTISYKINYFWSCDGEANPLPADSNICAVPRSYIFSKTIPEPLLVLTQYNPYSSYSQCDVIPYKACIKNIGLGGIGNLTASLIVPENVILKSDSIHVTVVTTDYLVPTSALNSSVQVNGDTLWTMNLSDSTAFAALSPVGFDGICALGATADEICIDFQLQATCSVNEIPALTLHFDGDLYCGESFNEAIRDSLLQDSVLFVFPMITLASGSCGSMVSVDILAPNAPCYGPIGITVTGPATDTIWLPSIPAFTQPDTGKYIVTVSNILHCTVSDTITVPEKLTPIIKISGDPCDGSEIVLYVDSLSPSFTGSYLWSTGATTDTIHVTPTPDNPALYSVTVTASNGCSDSDTISISRLAFANKVVDYKSCFMNDGAFALLSFFDYDSSHYSPGFSPYTFLWSDTNVVTSPIDGNTFLTEFLDTGSFYLTITDSMGCTAAGLFKINPDDSIKIIVDSLPSIADCSFGMLSIHAEGSLDSSYQYLWSTGDTTKNIIISEFGTYYVTVTNANNCFIIWEYVSTPPFSYCCFANLDSATIMVNQDTSSSLLNIPSGTQVYIADSVTLTVDTTLILKQCEVVLGKHARIVIYANDTLEVLGSYLHGCIEMWEGISFADNAVVVIANDDTVRSIIQDALIAVYSQDGAKVQATDAEFVNNRIGVKVDSGGTYLGFVEGCSFKYDSVKGMLPPYEGKRPGSGITVSNTVHWHIPEDNHTSNTFIGLNNGINGRMNEQLHVYGNTFIGINNFEPCNTASCILLGNGNAHFGSAVYVSCDPQPILVTPGGPYGDPVLPISNGIGQVQKCSFSNCNVGVRAIAVHAAVHDNTMNEMVWGVDANKCWYKHVLVYNDTIDDVNYGITLRANTGASVRAYNNIIHVRNLPVALPAIVSLANGSTLFSSNAIADNYYGVKLNEGMAPSYSTRIYNNQIYHGRSGIELQNPQIGCEVYSNEIFQNDSQAVYLPQNGVLVTGGKKFRIYENTITGSGAVGSIVNYASNNLITSYNRKRGIALQRSQNYEISCDTLNFLQYGLYFEQNCSASDSAIHENVMNYYYNGLRLQKLGQNGNIGGQIGNANLTNDNVWSDNGDTSMIEMYNFSDSIVQLTQVFWGNGFLPNNFQSRSNIPNKAVFNLSANPGASILSDCQNIELRRLSYFDSMENAIANNTAVFSEFGQLSLWLSRKDLYAKISELYENSELEDSVMVSFYEDYQRTSVGRSEDYKLPLLAIADTSLFLDTPQINTLLYSAYETNDLLPTDSLYENNLKIVNLLFLKHIAFGNYSLDSQDITFIENLAFKCPYIEGDAVYTARYLYEELADTFYYIDDLTLCFEEVSGKMDNVIKRSEPSSELKPPSNLSIIPNPVKDNAIVLYQLQINEMAVLSIYDVTGHKVSQLILEKDFGKVNLDLSKAHSGVYVYTAIGSLGSFLKGKLIITR